MIEPVERFVRGFGAVQTPYFAISHIRSDVLLRQLFVRYLRPGFDGGSVNQTELFALQLGQQLLDAYQFRLFGNVSKPEIDIMVFAVLSKSFFQITSVYGTRMEKLTG